MSIKFANLPPGSNQPFTLGGGVSSDWIKLLSEFPDRFVIGSDSFFMPQGGNNTEFKT